MSFVMKNRLIPIFLLVTVFLTSTAGCLSSERPATCGNLVILVLGDERSFLSGAKVISSNQPEGQLKVTGITLTNGKVKFNSIKAGEYNFYISHYDYEQQEFHIIVAAGKTIEKAITLQRTQGIP
jgi:hypothetical protein